MINKRHWKRNYFGPVFFFFQFLPPTEVYQVHRYGNVLRDHKVTSPWVQQWTAQMQSNRSDCVAVQQWSLLSELLLCAHVGGRADRRSTL
jgi:hypothetical protein